MTLGHNKYIRHRSFLSVSGLCYGNINFCCLQELLFGHTQTPCLTPKRPFASFLILKSHNFWKNTTLQTPRYETTGILQISRLRIAGWCSLEHTQPGEVWPSGMAASPSPKPWKPGEGRARLTNLPCIRGITQGSAPANADTWILAALEHQQSNPAQNTTQNYPPKNTFCT